MSEETLRRYTNIPALIYLLRKKAISLLDPASWDDSNDRYYLELYREKRRLRSILAACFTQSAETYHHWRVFADGSSGACIKFRHRELMRAVESTNCIRAEKVQYLTLSKLRRHKLKIDELPFLKRYAFQHESEFRIIFESTDRKITKLDLNIPLSCIESISINPWIHTDLFDQLKRVIWSIDGCIDIGIRRSSLIGNEQWKAYGESVS